VTDELEAGRVAAAYSGVAYPLRFCFWQRVPGAPRIAFIRGDLARGTGTCEEIGFETKPAARNGTDAQSSAILSSAFISVLTTAALLLA
jgi:hypothetical protein